MFRCYQKGPKMQIETYTSRIESSAGLRSYLEEKAEQALRRFADRIESVTVTVEDTNGPRGGVDKASRVSVKLHGDPQALIADAVHEEIGGALKLALDKSVYAVSRRIDRRRTHRRRQPLPV